MKVQQTQALLNLVNKQQQPQSQSQHSDKPNQTIQKDFKVMKRLATYDLKETTQQQRNKILTNRFNKFYLYNLKKNKALGIIYDNLDYLDEKPEVDIVNQDVIVDYLKVLVYGTDFMNKRKIEDHFKLIKGEIVTSLNGSCSQIVVETPERTREILSRVLVNVDELDDLNSLKWVQLNPYYEQGIERKIEARLGTNRDVIKKVAGNKEYIEQETKKEFYKQSLTVKNRLVRNNNRRYDEIKMNLSIFEKKLDPPSNFIEQPFNSALMLSMDQRDIQLISQDENEIEEREEINQSLGNFEHSMQLDISNIQDVSYPNIYDEPRNIHQFKDFKKYNYNDYQKEQEEKEKDKKKEIQVIVIDDDQE